MGFYPSGRERFLDNNGVNLCRFIIIPQIELGMARIAEDNDFDYLKKLVDEPEGWIIELDKADTRVWTRPIDGCSFQMVKIQTVFPDITSETVNNYQRQ